MTSLNEARDAICGAIRTAWLADPTTTGIALLWDDVEGDKPGTDATGQPLPWARVTISHGDAYQETFGGSGCRKFANEGAVVVQVFTPTGDGRTLSDAIMAVIKAALRFERVGDLWFRGGRVQERGRDGAWTRTDWVSEFTYSEAG